MHFRRIMKWVVVVIFGLGFLFFGLRLFSLWNIGRIGFYDGTWVEMAANPEKGFFWPFQMYIPKQLLEKTQPTRLWLRSNNSGTNDDQGFHHKKASQLLAVSRQHADALQTVVIVPSFPRPKARWKVYTHALDRDTILEEPPIGKLDQQLLAMANEARSRLQEMGLSVCQKFFLDGFSASGMFTSRFTMIHPEYIAAAAIGAPGGWPMVPANTYQEKSLRFPIGTSDFETLFGKVFSKETVSKVPMLFYLGEKDMNDSVPFRDGYEEQDETLINTLFGETPFSRWSKAEKLFAGFQAKFNSYPGVGHEVTKEMQSALIHFFQENDHREQCESDASYK